MMCQRTGRPPTSTIGLGRVSVCSRRRVPMPPQRIRTFIGRGAYAIRRVVFSRAMQSRPRLVLSANATPGAGGQGLNEQHMLEAFAPLADVTAFDRRNVAKS